MRIVQEKFQNELSNFDRDIPLSIIDALRMNYSSGFRFDSSCIKLLSKMSGERIDESMQESLERFLFAREDGIYYLIETIAAPETINDIKRSAYNYLREYHCFEISEIFSCYKNRINIKCIRDVNDFEGFYARISGIGIRFANAFRNNGRLACNTWEKIDSILTEIADKILTIITNDFYGSCNEDELHTQFGAFSKDFLARTIHRYASTSLIKVKIGDSVCYQTYAALGLPDNFSSVVEKIVDKTIDAGLEPNQEVLHTALSLAMGKNFMREYNLPDWETFRTLFHFYSQANREWKNNVFKEA